jgi:cell division protein ZapD
MIRYEHPLNERIRTLMRLEDLFERALYFGEQDAPAEHHAALFAIFEIIEVAARGDLKSELLQELERQRQLLIAWRDNPSIAQEALSGLVAEVEAASSRLLALSGKLGQHVRASEWLMSIKQRSAIPGGVCEFDLPAYHYWLHRDAQTRKSNLAEWLSPLDPVREALKIVLRFLRESGKTSRHVASQGVFQQMLTSSKSAQLLRLTLGHDLACIPEISANKYALNIRFVEPTRADRSKLYEGDIEFELTFCTL